jgi:hypothetical protein
MPLLLLCARSKICQRHEHILCLRIGFVKITVKSQLPQISKSTTNVHPCFEVNTVSSTLERLNVISLKLKRNKTFYRFLNVKKCLQTVQYHHELLTIPTYVHKSTNCASEQRISRNERELRVPLFIPNNATRDHAISPRCTDTRFHPKSAYTLTEIRNRTLCTLCVNGFRFMACPMYYTPQQNKTSNMAHEEGCPSHVQM